MSIMDPYDLEQVRREWIGRMTPSRRGRYPVEYDPIRRHCRMVEDMNPLFLDPEYAGRTRWGGVIAPPVMIEYFAGNGAWPPSEESTSIARGVPTRGDRLINLNTAWEYFEPVRVGDHLAASMKVVDVYEKPIGLDPLAIWIVTERQITNQRGDVVAVGRATLLTHRTPEEIAAADDGYLRMLDFQMRRMNRNGDTMHVRGRVLGRTEVDDAWGDVEIEVWIENEREGTTTPGRAIVRMPRSG
jgi:acyl dehydratase